MSNDSITIRKDLAQAWHKASREQRREAEQALERILAPSNHDLSAEPEPTITFEQIKHLAGVLKGGPADGSSNPAYLEGLGERSLS